MKLLKITEHEYSGFEEAFEQVEELSLKQISPRIIDGEAGVTVNGSTISEYDSAFLEIPKKNAVFGRVLLEAIEEKDINVNYPSTAFFVMAKKNYLYYVLHQRNISAPKTVAVASEKATRNVEKELKGPLIARKLEELEENERKKLDEVNDIQDFAEGSEYEEDVLLFHEYTNADKYRCLVIGDNIISLQDTSEDWRFYEDSLQYSNLSSDQKELVIDAVKAVGTPYAEVVLRGNEVFDINPNPDLEMYSDLSGKNIYGSVAEALKDE